MTSNKRKENRFSDIGKVICPNLCVFPGVLLDVSLTGAHMRFPAVLTSDRDQEYEFSISLFGKATNQPFLLIARLQWVREDNNTTSMGVSFIHSPSTKALSEYIAEISAKEQTKADEHNFFMEVDYV